MSEAGSDEDRRSTLAVPAYVQDHGDPAALFTRLQRVVIHLELLQAEAVRDFDPIEWTEFRTPVRVYECMSDVLDGAHAAEPRRQQLTLSSVLRPL